MTDDELDLRPAPDHFARALAARAAAAAPVGTAPSDWLRGWQGHAARWPNLRSDGHWIERAGA